MGKLDRIQKIGLWPRVLGAELAAIYCGVSATFFFQRVETGIYPQPFPNGALVQWDRDELDEAIEALKQKRKTPVEAAKTKLDAEIDGWTPESSARR